MLTNEIIKFRDFKPDDLNKYLEMTSIFYSSDAVSEEIPISYARNTFNLCIQRKPYLRGILLLKNEEIIGYSILTFAYYNESGGLTLWVDELFIFKKHRGLGYGKKFFEFIEHEYRNKIKKIFLDVSQENKAIKLYEKLGYSFNSQQNMYKKIL